MNKHNERGMFSLLVHADFFVFAFLPGGVLNIVLQGTHLMNGNEKVPGSVYINY